MTLVYIANIRLPTEKAHGIHIMKMCEAFACAGAEVMLVVPTRKNPGLAAVDPFDYYRTEKKFAIRFVKCPDPEFLMRFPWGAYIKAQRILFAHAVKSFLKSSGIGKDDILYTRDEHLLSTAQRYSGRVVWEAHALPRHSWMYRQAWRKCGAIITITEYLRRELARQGIDEKKIIVARDGVDVERFDTEAGVAAREENCPLHRSFIRLERSRHAAQSNGLGESRIRNEESRIDVCVCGRDCEGCAKF